MCTTDDLHFWLDKMLSPSKYTFDLLAGNAKGDGYLGEVNFVTVQTEKKALDLVIKSAKKSDQLREKLSIEEAYHREIFFYDQIFPAFENLQKNLSKPFDNIAKCYSVCSEPKKEALILHNLKKKGFELHDRQRAMDLDHAVLVFSHYGRYHALSLALNRKKPVLFENLTNDLTDMFGSIIVRGGLLKIFEKKFQEILRELPGEVGKKYEGFQKKFLTILVNLSAEAQPVVVTHGDCWNNNFMFKYQASRPEEIKILDFQMSRLASPVLDLSYFLYCCCDASVFKNFDFLLEVYHGSLGGLLEELGCEVEEVFPLRVLKAHWSKYGSFGLVLSLFILNLAMCEADEVPDVAESAENGGDFGSFDVSGRNGGEVARRLREGFAHFAQFL